MQKGFIMIDYWKSICLLSMSEIDRSVRSDFFVLFELI
jgi:hypothetical protein